jgi:hypothetical protein
MSIQNPRRKAAQCGVTRSATPVTAARIIPPATNVTHFKVAISRNPTMSIGAVGNQFLMLAFIFVLVQSGICTGIVVI